MEREKGVAMAPTPQGRVDWTYLTNHTHVLICVYRDPHVRTRDIAEAVGITERATQAIVADLVASGCLTRTRDGRRNLYHVDTSAPFRHPLEAHRTVGELLTLFEGRPGSAEGVSTT